MRRVSALLTGLAILCAACAPPPAQPRPAGEHTDVALQHELEQLTAGFHGTVGVYVRQLSTGATASIRANEIFPTASIVKVPLLVKMMDRVERGELDLDTVLVFRDSLRYTDEDILGEFRDSATIPLSQVAFLTAAVSDNSAALWIQALDGGGEAVNAWLAENGFESTRVNSRTPGRHDDWEVYGWGQTTPREMSDLMVRIRRGEVVSPAASEELYRLLTRSYWYHVALWGIPPTVQAASKQGAVNHARGETLVVNAPTGDYVLTVLTREQADSTWAPTNEGWELIRHISRAVYTHFNPNDPWKPAEPLGEWRG
ncbi:MAG TPA: serine hydrolase [Longimicrobiaceae bacterium]|nr:serine hydrolase [Longimicrobiaceae bacterium]